MSGNPKQTAAGGQQMRYTTSPYQPLQPQLPPRDTFQLTNPNYVQQQPNQVGSQGPGLRGIGQTGPPNQASTPPNQDLKVQAVPQQAPMNLYQPQNAVRQQHFSYRPPGPPNQTPRMPNNQHRGQQQLYPAPNAQFLQMPVHSSMFINPLYYNTGQQRQSFVQQPVALLQGQHFTAYPGFTQTPITQTPQTVYPFYPPMPRAGPPPQPTSTPSNPTQTPIPPMPLAQPLAPQQPLPRHRGRRPNAIAIIDPDTSVNILDEIYEQDSSHPPSGESSARQTPQPAPHNPNKEVQATFAKQVAQVLNDEETSSYEEDHQTPTLDHIEPPHVFQPPPQQAVHNAKYDILQNTNLKVYAKEFVLTSAKETPIVSANCDSAEVTIPNKLQKGRESPAKGRKRESKDHHRESIKDVHVSKEAHQVEKQPVPVQKEEPAKPKESSIPVVPCILVQDNRTTKPTDKETDKRKKESKSDSKLSEPNTTDKCMQLTPNQEAEPVAAPSAKTKQNASQRKESQKSNQKAAPGSVPPPQPTKSSSKTSKKNEINNKGASKEGTEMDVFQIADTVNANVPSATNNSDVINANTVPETINSSPVINSNANVVSTNHKKNESNDTMTIKPTPEAAKPAAQKVDVTNVFGGKVLKPSSFIPPPPTDTNRDETDRSVMANNDKLIQAKNEANTTKTANPSDAVESKSALRYEKDQWSPSNTDGNKKYGRDFLLALRNLPPSMIKPDLPDFLASEFSSDGGRLRSLDNSRQYSMGRTTDYTNPPFLNAYGGKNSSMKGQQSISKHGSLSGKMNNKPGKSGAGGGNKISISLREDIKLHESENAWKPGRLSKVDTRGDEERKTEDLYKKVRGVLNKLTPQKFDTLLNQIKSLQVDTIDRLQGVINLIFEKAVDEPNFSVAYAKMCRELGNLEYFQVQSGPDKKDEVSFRKLLINRCQEEFEKQSKDETRTKEKRKEIDECTDAEKKKELEFELEEINRRIRMRSVGNIRFIGELFKIHMLTASIMLTCLNILLTSKDEESLECLCKLLTTVGKELEDNMNKDLTKFFNIMQEIVDKKHVKCSSRIRFMLQDVIDLRKSKWVPRRQDLNPKTIDQIQKEADNEQLNQAMSSVPNTPRKDERMGGDMNKAKSRVTDEGGWITRQQRAPFTVQKDKLKMNKVGDDEPLGGHALFQNWGKGAGSQIKPGSSHLGLTNTTNKFALLDNNTLEIDKKMSGGRYKDSAYSSKGSSLERSSYSKQNYDNRAGSRSGSQHRMNEPPASLVSQRMAAPPVLPVAVVPVKPAPAPIPPAHPQMTEEQMERYFKNCLEEFINDNCTFEECESDIRITFPVSYMPRMVADGYLGVLEKFANARNKTGILFAKLIKVGTLPLEEFCVGLEEIFSQVEDLIIDIPMIWNYLAEILVPVICENALPLNRLLKSCETIIGNNKADKLLAPIFKLIISEKGPNFLTNLWQHSELQFSHFMSADKTDSFIKQNQLEFLVGGKTVEGNSELNYEQIQKKLLEFFYNGSQFDDICNWITANVGERVKEARFIRTLATAIYKFSINRTKLEPERLSRHYKLFQKYVDNNQVYELQCLYALQSLVCKLEHPQGLLLSIFTKLSEDVIFPQESFIAWETSEDPAEQEGKGVATKQLTSFFTQLKENDDDDDYVSTGSEEA